MEGRQDDDTDEDSFELEPLCLHDAFDECAREEGRRPWAGVRNRRKEARRGRKSFFDEEVMGGQENEEETILASHLGKSSGGGQVLKANDHRDQGDPRGLGDYAVDEDGVVDLCGDLSPDVAKGKGRIEASGVRNPSKASSAGATSSRLGVAVSPAASSSQGRPPQTPSILLLSSDEEE